MIKLRWLISALPLHIDIILQAATYYLSNQKPEKISVCTHARVINALLYGLNKSKDIISALDYKKENGIA